MNKRLRFVETENRLSSKQYINVLNYFDKSLIVGSELERQSPLDNNAMARRLNTRRATITDSDLRSYKVASSNNFNVAFIKYDGTVTGGNEIIFSGTNEDIKFIHARLKAIEEVLDSNGSDDYNHTASTHITLMTLQDRAINPIIVKNLYNMSRAFADVIYFLGSGDKATMIRNRCMHYAKANMTITPTGKSFSSLKDNTGKYSMLNISKNPTISIGSELLQGIYVEFRNVDGIRIPSVISALMMMYKSMMFKAIELSYHGLVEVQSLTNWNKAKSNVGALRSGDQSDELIQSLTERSQEFLKFIGTNLNRISPEAFEIVKELAKSPVSICHKKNITRKTIEKKFGKIIENDISQNDKIVLEALISHIIVKPNAKEWRMQMAKVLNVSTRMVEYHLTKIAKSMNRIVEFDNEVQSYIIK